MNEGMIMQLKNRRLTQVKKLVIPVKKKSLRNQALIIKADFVKLGSDVALGYEILKELIEKKMNRKVLVKNR